jgi:hypothetical protein
MQTLMNADKSHGKVGLFPGRTGSGFAIQRIESSSIMRSSSTALFPAFAILLCGFACAQFQSSTLDREYENAGAAFDSGDYGLAAACFENLLDRTPDGPRREQGLYKQGVAYYQIKDYHDADEVFSGYQRLYPDGTYRLEVFDYRMQIAVYRSGANPAAQERLEEAKGELSLLLKLEQEHSTDPRIKYYLGNIYYELGQYAEAARKYAESMAIKAVYKDKELIRKRLFVNDEGQFEVRTPSAIQEIERKEHPLVVFDIESFLERGSSSFEARKVTCLATGFVRNQGDEPLHNVEIETRFLGARGMILSVDVKRFPVLAPGEVRGFSAVGKNYDDILNIRDVVFVPRWDGK